MSETKKLTEAELLKLVDDEGNKAIIGKVTSFTPTDRRVQPIYELSQDIANKAFPGGDNNADDEEEG